jgi:adenine phosphoribosyltransferase
MAGPSILDLKSFIRDVPDFPKPGILFRDITTLLKHPAAFEAAVGTMTDEARSWEPELIAGIESRGFILGAAVARAMNIGFVPIRKPGKLPAETLCETYALEYGTDALEIHRDACEVGTRVLVLDDLLATGGTSRAACALVEGIGARVAGIGFLVELTDLDGREQLVGRDIFSIIRY